MFNLNTKLTLVLQLNVSFLPVLQLKVLNFSLKGKVLNQTEPKPSKIPTKASLYVTGINIGRLFVPAEGLVN